MRIAVCDDNLAELNQLCALLNEYKDIHNFFETYIDRFQSSLSLLDDLKNGKNYDLFLLDIIMPEMTGIDLARILKEKRERFSIIFVTNAREFALEAFDVDAVNYILKPVSKESLFPAIDRAARF